MRELEDAIYDLEIALTQIPQEDYAELETIISDLQRLRDKYQK